jgi:hypothetical protein
MNYTIQGVKDSLCSFWILISKAQLDTMGTVEMSRSSLGGTAYKDGRTIRQYCWISPTCKYINKCLGLLLTSISRIDFQSI